MCGGVDTSLFLLTLLSALLTTASIPLSDLDRVAVAFLVFPAAAVFFVLALSSRALAAVVQCKVTVVSRTCLCESWLLFLLAALHRRRTGVPA